MHLQTRVKLYRACTLPLRYSLATRRAERKWEYHAGIIHTNVNYRSKSSDAAESDKPLNGKEIQDTTIANEESEMSRLVERLKKSNGSNAGKFSRSPGGSKLRSVLRVPNQAEEKKQVANIVELFKDEELKAPLSASHTIASSEEDSTPVEAILPKTQTEVSENSPPGNEKRISLRDVVTKKNVPKRSRKTDSKKGIADIFGVQSKSMESEQVSTKDTPTLEASVGTETKIDDIKQVDKSEEPRSNLTLRDLTSHQATRSGRHTRESTQEADLKIAALDSLISDKVPQEELSEEPSSVVTGEIFSSEESSEPIIDADASISSLRDITSIKRGPFKRKTMPHGQVDLATAKISVSDFLASDDVTSESSDSTITPSETDVKPTRSALDQLISEQMVEAFENLAVSEEETSVSDSVHTDDCETGSSSLSRYLKEVETTDADASQEQIMKKVLKSATKHGRSYTFRDAFDGPRLGIFSEEAETTPSIKEFTSTYERDFHHYLDTLESSVEPSNGFEEHMRVSDQVWQLPVDNEVCKVDEEDVGFEEHVFLDHLLDEFPPVPQIQQFMELVINGLQQNPHLSVEQKRSRVYWFKDYFSKFSDEDLQVNLKEFYAQ